eukprot:scaffold10296_cov84-Skeletonema_marinoi.AAC.1
MIIAAAAVQKNRRLSNHQILSDERHFKAASLAPCSLSLRSMQMPLRPPNAQTIKMHNPSPTFPCANSAYQKED